MSSSSELKIPFRDQNIKTAERISSLIDATEGTGSVNYHMYVAKETGCSIDLARHQSDYLEKLPSGFQYPLYYMQVLPRTYQSSINITESTPYGRFTHMVLDSGDNLVYFDNVYLFDEFGFGVNHVTTYSNGNYGSFFEMFPGGLTQISIDDIPRIDFRVRREDFGAIDLGVGDYEKIEFYLQGIESGRFRQFMDITEKGLFRE